MDWIIGLQKAIDYIEDNLTETIDYEMVAKTKLFIKLSLSTCV